MSRKNRLDEDSLRKCIRLIALGVADGWEMLWDSFLGFRIRKWCQHTANGTENRIDSLHWQELFQECNINIFLWAVRNVEHIDDIVSIEGILCRIVKNICATQLGKALKLNYKEELSDDGRTIRKEDDIIGYIENKNCLIKLMEYANLREIEKTILMLKSEGYTVDEMSKKLKCPKDTIKTRYRRAIAKIKSIEDITDLKDLKNCMKAKIIPLRVEK